MKGLPHPAAVTQAKVRAKAGIEGKTSFGRSVEFD